jgi:lysophospholipase L1-like esterase
MLFVGDSLSVGYGVEGKSIKCDSERKYKNNRLSFAAVTALELFADYHVIAVSGRGVVRNYNDPKQASDRPLPSYLDNTLYNDDSVKWNHASWVPDMIVVNLGTNDFSTEPKPGKKEFLKGYRDLTAKLRKLYPKAQIYCCTGPAQSEPFFIYMDEFFEKNKDKKLYRVNMSMMTEKDWGCDYHPNIKAAERMAGEFISRLQAEPALKKSKPKKK